MFVDKMHTAAIETANRTMLPQTVYCVGNNWMHAEATWMRGQVRDMKRNGVTMVCTWLPEGFFNV